MASLERHAPRGIRFEHLPVYADARAFALALGRLDAEGAGRKFDRVWLVDGRMLAVRELDPFPFRIDGPVVVEHPAVQSARSRELLPYDRRPESRACVPIGSEGLYFASGSFVLGSTSQMRGLLDTLARWVDDDDNRGVVPATGEQYLNRFLLHVPPSMCLPAQQWCKVDGLNREESGVYMIRYERPGAPERKQG